ncbi:RNA polymerase sigma factor [Mariniblastus fucicola]|uniref:ECF RNA polymerase sigma factor SigD n=1 Tax=Mariniblastus fucicola TaxID=980251 RepID=A0A5B9P335_9BACT|nr:sigma-70 family RNA polymerase sigma factor [Mariniblastus fucicola]QEG20574.1 ECF RNA polymerase sigma factor SigD [Mariniblastus fucicola]
MTDSAEQKLVDEIARGNRESLAEFFQLRRFDLLAVILSKMGPGLRKKVEAEDIFQEVCTTALQSLDKVQISDSGPFGWLCEIADRRIIDQQRKFAAGKRDSSRETGIHGKSDDDVGLVNLLVASITSPSRAFSRHQKEFRLIQAMKELPETQQQVLELRYSKGKSSKEIAAEIGKSDGATRVLITRSLQKLKEVLG